LHVGPAVPKLDDRASSGVESAGSASDLRRSYRTWEQSIGVGILGVIGSTFVTLGGLAMSMAPTAVVGVLMTLVGVLGYLGTWRAVRAGVRADEHGVVIMNPLRSTTVPWAEVERFSVGAHGLWPRVGIVHLRDGSTVAIWGIQGPNPVVRPKNRSAERLIVSLNHRLEAARCA
jgi:hypothetical protein